MAELIRYGDHRDQVVEIHEPAIAAGAAPGRVGLAVLVHGGYWRQAFDRSLMQPVADDLHDRGWAVANLEYRRGSAGLRATLADARGAVEAARAEAARRGWDGQVVSIGHSVGGQLALLSADLVDAVVALAPVTDLERTREEGLGEEAVREFIAESPREAPLLYAVGSPSAHLPVDRPVLLVHGEADVRVPLAHSEDYVARSRAAGDEVELRVLSGAGHIELIDPAQPWWPGVVDWMGAVSPAAPTG